MANLLEVRQVLARLEKVTDIFLEATSIRLAAFLESRGRQPMADSDESRAYEKGFTAGLNSGLRIARVELADLDVDKVCEAFRGTSEGEGMISDE